MQALRFEGHVLVARAWRQAQRTWGGRIDVSAPGQVLLRRDPQAIRRLAPRLRRGTVAISATNGKTTTANLTASILAAAGWEPVCNRTGANMPTGVAAELLTAARIGGRIRGTIGVFEVDELWLGRVAEQLTPRALLLGNLFRDQLDRCGEPAAVAGRWADVLARHQGRSRIVVCADDPLLGALAESAPDVTLYGLDSPHAGSPALRRRAESDSCRRCGGRLAYRTVYVGHLGDYWCPCCGWARPKPAIVARDVELDGVTGSRFDLVTSTRATRVSLPLAGLHNVYNALAAASLCHVLGVPLDTTVRALERATPAFGRGETIAIGGCELVLVLVKNPAGADEVLRTIASSDNATEIDLLWILNDPLDGSDVSWIWDVDVERWAGSPGRVTCSGSRATDIAERLEYAGVPTGRIVVEPDLAAGLNGALERCDGRVFALASYTGMLATRELVAERGWAERYWR